MGGRLEVESVLGKGSTFSVVIPDVKMAPDRADAINCVPPVADAINCVPPAADAQKRVPPVQQPHRILLVDDSKMNLMVLKALVKKAGDYETELSMDGQEALAALSAAGDAPFDLVLTDMWMPNLDGEGLVKSIRANASLASLRVLVVTADVEIREKAKTMGFDGILLKPVTTAALEQVLLGNGGGVS